MTDRNDMREALQACVDAMLHDGVPTDPEHPKQVALNAAEAALDAQAESGAAELPKIHGVSRVLDNPCALLLLLKREPSDDNLREIHDRLAAPSREQVGETEKREGNVEADARRMRTLCRLLDAMDDVGNGFPGDVHAAFQDGAKRTREALDAQRVPEDDASPSCECGERKEPYYRHVGGVRFKYWLNDAGELQCEEAASAPTLSNEQINLISEKWSARWSTGSAWNTKRCIDNALREACTLIAASAPTLGDQPQAAEQPIHWRDNPQNIALLAVERGDPVDCDGTFACPICGKDEPHQHSSDEIAKFRITQRQAADPKGLIEAIEALQCPETHSCSNPELFERGWEVGRGASLDVARALLAKGEGEATAKPDYLGGCMGPSNDDGLGGCMG